MLRATCNVCSATLETGDAPGIQPVYHLHILGASKPWLRAAVWPECDAPTCTNAAEWETETGDRYCSECAPVHVRP